jgi:hypothetical protein
MLNLHYLFVVSGWLVVMWGLPCGSPGIFLGVIPTQNGPLTYNLNRKGCRQIMYHLGCKCKRQVYYPLWNGLIYSLDTPIVGTLIYVYRYVIGQLVFLHSPSSWCQFHFYDMFDMFRSR